MQSVEGITASYPGLFDSGGSEEDSGSGGFATKWGWFVTLDNLSNSNLLQWDEYMAMNVTPFLNLCAYIKDKQKEQERINWKAQQQLKG